MLLIVIHFFCMHVSLCHKMHYLLNYLRGKKIFAGRGLHLMFPSAYKHWSCSRQGQKSEAPMCLSLVSAITCCHPGTHWQELGVIKKLDLDSIQSNMNARAARDVFSAIHSFLPQMTWAAGIVPGWNQKLAASSRFPTRVWGLEHLGHLWLVSQDH